MPALALGKLTAAAHALGAHGNAGTVTRRGIDAIRLAVFDFRARLAIEHTVETAALPQDAVGVPLTHAIRVRNVGPSRHHSIAVGMWSPWANGGLDGLTRKSPTARGLGWFGIVRPLCRRSTGTVPCFWFAWRRGECASPRVGGVGRRTCRRRSCRCDDANCRGAARAWRWTVVGGRCVGRRAPNRHCGSENGPNPSCHALMLGHRALGGRDFVKPRNPATSLNIPDF